MAQAGKQAARQRESGGESSVAKLYAIRGVEVYCAWHMLETVVWETGTKSTQSGGMVEMEEGKGQSCMLLYRQVSSSSKIGHIARIVIGFSIA